MSNMYEHDSDFDFDDDDPLVPHQQPTGDHFLDLLTEVAARNAMVIADLNVCIAANKAELAKLELQRDAHARLMDAYAELAKGDAR